MTLTCQYEELDDKTRAYLQDVAARRGRGAPGVYVHRGNPRPIWAVIVGPFVGLMLLLVSFGSTKDPWAVAMLQTAAVLVGGWSVWYAVRRWAAGRSKKYGGYFAYFDPLHAYEVNGETVRVTDLAGVRGVEALPAGGGTVAFDLGYDRHVAVRLKNLRAAKDVEDYYAAMDDLETREGSKWAEADLAELGAAARYTSEEDQFPRNVNDLDLDIDRVPEEPERARQAGSGVLGLAAIVFAAAGVYGLFFLANSAVADDMAFDRAKDGGAPGLRGYLLDDRHQAHRDEAKQLLANCYDGPVARLRSQAAPGERPELREGMAKLVDSLRTTEAPVVSIGVTEDGGAAGAAERATKLREGAADGLARGVGPDLIAFAAPAEGVQAHIAVKYRYVKLTRPPGQPPGGPTDAAEVEIEIRLDPTAEPVATGKWNVVVAAPGDAFSVDQIKVGVCQVLVGSYVPAPVIVDAGGGDF